MRYLLMTLLAPFLCYTSLVAQVENLEVEGKIKIIGNSYSIISNSNSTNREILQFHAKSDGFGTNNDGAGINLYGNNDANAPGSISLFTGGETAFRVHNDQTIEVYNRIEFKGNIEANGLIKKNAATGRDELQLYSGGDAYTDGSNGAGLHLYGNFDNKHAGNIAFLTGNVDAGNGRMIIAGGGGPLDRQLTDTRVTIGNGIWDRVDNEDDTGMLNLHNPVGRPALFITGTGASEGELAVPSGEALNFGQWNDVTFSSMMEIDGIGNVGIGTTSPACKLEVSGAFMLEDGNAPNATSGHSGLYSSSGELCAFDANNNLTIISPHHFELLDPSEDMAWSFYSINTIKEKKLNVDMMKVVRQVEKICGEKLIHLSDMQGNEIEQILEKSELEQLRAENKILKERLKKIEEFLGI